MITFILPNTDPFIVTYPDYTNLFFAFGDRPEVQQWLISRAIGLMGVWTPDTYGMVVNFYDTANPWYCTPADTCPYIITQYIDELVLMEMKEDVIPFLIRQIERGYYINLYVDNYELSCFGDYKTTHYIHDILLYGFDLSKDFFYVAGFINGRGYERKTIPFSEVASSLLNKSKEKNRQNTFFRYNGDSELVNGSLYCSFLHPYNMSEEYLRNELKYYLLDTRYEKYPNVYMGIEVYTLYKKYCGYLSDTLQEYVFKQAIQVVYAHKKILKAVVQRLCKDQELFPILSNDLDELIHGLLLIRNCLIKYSIARQPEKFKSTIPWLDDMMNKEYCIIKRIIT